MAWDYGKSGTDWTSGFCSGGSGASAQSPIDLPAKASATDATKVFLKYPAMDSSVALYHSGHSLAITMPEGYRAGFGLAASPEALTHAKSTDAAFRLWQVTFHAPSEHTVAGHRMPLEIQFAHQQVTGNRTGKLAIVSVLFHEDVGGYDPFLERVLVGGLPQHPWDEIQVDLGSTDTPMPGEREVSDQKSPLQSLLAGSAYYVYDGSLTVPPCEPEVRHFLRQATVPASEAQLRPLAETLRTSCPPRGNYREIPVQTTAAGAVGLVSAVDWFAASVEEAVTSPVEPPSWFFGRLPQSKLDDMRRTMLEGDRSGFDELKAGDSPQLREAKTAYNRAVFDFKVASQEKRELDLNLYKAKEALARARGPVDALTLKWQVVSLTEASEKAKFILARRQRELNEASSQALAIVMGGERFTFGPHPLEQGSTTALPIGVPSAGDGSLGWQSAGAGTTQKVTTTLTADSAGFLWSNKPAELTVVRGGLVLPVGLAASPFIKEAPYTSATIGSGRASSTYGITGIKLTQDLRPDLPSGQVPVPPGTTQAPPALRAAAASQIILKLPIPPGSVRNAKQLEEDLLQALSSSVGVARSRLDIPEARAASLDVLTPEGALQPALVQRQVSGLTRWGRAA